MLIINGLISCLIGGYAYPREGGMARGPNPLAGCLYFPTHPSALPPFLHIRVLCVCMLFFCFVFLLKSLSLSVLRSVLLGRSPNARPADSPPLLP